MKNFCAFLLCLILTASCCFASAAGDVLSFFDAQYALLFNTTNVSLRGSAVFGLDGSVFKYADVTHVQTDDVAFREVVMHSPWENGTLKEHGYTLLIVGDCVYDVESGREGLQYHYMYPEKNTILTRRNGSEAILELIRLAADAYEKENPSAFVYKTAENGDSTMHFSAKEDDLPEAVHSLLTLFFRYVSGCYDKVDYLQMGPFPNLNVDDFFTISQGLTYATKDLRLSDIEMAATLNKEHELTSCEGKATLRVFTTSGDIHSVTVEWTETAEDYGTSRLESTGIADYDRWGKTGG